MLVPLVRGGEIACDDTLEQARGRLRSSLAELPGTAVQLSQGEPAIPTYYQA